MLKLYTASGAKPSSGTCPGGLMLIDGCTFISSTERLVTPGVGKTYKSEISSRASACGKLRSGPEKWFDQPTSPPGVILRYTRRQGGEVAEARPALVELPTELVGP